MHQITPVLLFRYLIINFGFVFLLNSCQVYKSPDRKEFESDSPQFRIQNLRSKLCSSHSLHDFADDKKLVYENKNVQIWELIIADQNLFESNTSQGVTCALEISAEN